MRFSAAGFLVWLGMSAALFSVCFPQPAAARPLQICISAKGKIIAKKKCAKGTEFSAAKIAVLATGGVMGPPGAPGEKGDKGDKGDTGPQGIPASSELLIVDGPSAGAIPACAAGPGGACFAAGSVITNAQCAGGSIAVGMVCVTPRVKGNAPTTSSATLNPSGASTCVHQNNTPELVEGTTLTRLVCMPMPSF